MGAALCLISAVAFGCMAIFGKLAFDAGVSTMTLLLVRFTFASTLFWLVIAARRRLRPSREQRRAILIGLALGAVGYALQAGLFFGALAREIDASLLALLLYSYPAWVTLGAFLIGRERPTRRRLVALAVSSAGLVVILATASGGQMDGIAAVMGVAAAITYTVYILVADAAGLTLHPLTLTALVCTGAATTFGILGVATAKVDLGFEPEGWMWLVALSVISTCLAISAFFAGLARVGPSTASILSTLEPVTTVVLAYLAFSERLSAAQLAGAVLVLSAAALLAAQRSEPETAPPT